MTRNVWIDGRRVSLAPAALLGQGGEAEVYDLGDGRVVKWWKPPDHPDFAGLPDAQDAAARRIAEAPAKLRALPGNLPAAVIAPCGLALSGKRVVGYVMPKVAGTALHAYGEPRWRRDHATAGEALVVALLELHDAIAGLHRAGVVVGDCNDLNVLVDGRRVHLIDVDSYQYGGFPCAMFSERFIDPRLCDPQLRPVRPHDPDSDWFAFAVMAMRSLLLVGPWGGVHQPADASKRCPPPARSVRRVSALGSDIVYPRAARPIAILPDELVDHLRDVFERDRRGVFPRALLERLHLRACPACGDEHAVVRCPSCAAVSMLPPVRVHGRVRAVPIAIPALATREVGSRGDDVWLDGGALFRRGRLGPERIGNVLAGQTRAWVGANLGVGFYRAGGYAVGFVFRPDRGPLDDRVALPAIRGQLVDAHAALAGDRAWLFLTCADRGRIATTAIVIADARVIAAGEIESPGSARARSNAKRCGDTIDIPGVAGACAAGEHLFVPTDDGIVRVEAVHGTVAQTRCFAETAPFVTSGDRLAIAPGGIDVIRRHDAVRLHLT